jgi:hypothetical protein
VTPSLAAVARRREQASHSLLAAQALLLITIQRLSAQHRSKLLAVRQSLLGFAELLSEAEYASDCAGSHE